MRILWVSNAGWSHQGYGVQVRGLLPHLIGQGHDVAVFAFWGLDGGKVELPLNGDGGPVLTHYPRVADPYGNDVVAAHARDWEADCVVTLMDIWVCDPNAYQGLNWLAWTPIDQEPIPEPVLARLPHARKVLPYSRFGERLIRSTGLDCTYIPHGVDTAVFRPFPEPNRAAAKEAMGFDSDVFLVGMVGANKGFPSRKGFPEAFQAFAEFHERVPQARLYVHSQIAASYGGPNLQQLAEMCGIGPYVRFPDQYQLAIGLPAEAMAVAYNAMDVLLQASTHEGFGLPMIEAQACGTPVIATNSTSMTELIGTGIAIRSVQKQLTTMMSWAAVPSVEDIATALAQAYESDHPDRAAVRAFAERYSWELVADEYWRPLLDQLADELDVPSSRDRDLKRAMAQARFDDERKTFLEGTRHGCCCEHVVDSFEAMPGDPQVVTDAARDKLAGCPHRDAPSELELWLGSRSSGACAETTGEEEQYLPAAVSGQEAIA